MERGIGLTLNRLARNPRRVLDFLKMTANASALSRSKASRSARSLSRRMRSRMYSLMFS